MLATTATIHNPNLVGNGGAYFRVSDDDQEVATQHRTIEDFEQRYGVAIQKAFLYEDIAWSRDEVDRRPDWLRMLADVDARKLQWIVVAAKDRFGTASGRKKVNLYSRLWDADCKLILASTGEVLNAPSLSSDITALVDGEQEQLELRQKSDRALAKMAQHAEAGRWMGGSIPFGLDVICTDSLGKKELWRVLIEGENYRVKISPHGERQTYEGENNFPGRDKGQILTLRPSVAAVRLGIVRDVFKWFDVEELSTYQIAARLNDRGDRHPLGEWTYYLIETILKNYAYIGIPVWNRTSQAKWGQFIGGVAIPHKERNTRHKDHDRADWIVPTEQFTPIVSVEQFERVQKKLASRSQKPRAPKSAALWLSGLLFCKNCGGKLHGTMKAGVPTYICENYLRTLDGSGRPRPRTKMTDSEKNDRKNQPVVRGCEFYTVKHAKAEAYLKDFFAETGQLWPNPNSAIAVPWSEKSAWTDAIASMAAAVGQMIERVKLTTPDRHTPDPNKPAKKYRVTDLPDGLDVPALYRAIFASEREQWTAHLDQVETAHTHEFQAWKDAPTARTKAKAKARLDELETEIDQIEAKLANAGDTYDEARNQIAQLRTDWLAAQSAIETDTGARQKAAAIRKVIARIELKFAVSGLKRGKYYIQQVDIVPVEGSPVSVSNQAPAARRPIPKSVATHAFACGTHSSRLMKPPAIIGLR